MANTFKNNKSILAQCYLILLAASALLCRPVFLNCIRELQYSELFILWKPTPWMLTPLLICALLAAFYTEKGYGKNVGITGILLMLAAVIVQSGCMLWMTTLESESNVLLVKLNNYSMRFPIAFFLVGFSFMRGGAIAVMISLLSHVRQRKNANKESQLFASIAILTSVLAIWLIVVHPNMTWLFVGASGFVFALMLLPALFYYIRLDEDRYEVVDDEPKECPESRIKPSILPILIIIVCAIIITSIWRYMPTYWWEKNVGHGPENAFTLSISSLAIGIGVLVLRNKEPQNNKPLIGSIILLFGLPFVPLLLEYKLLGFIPQVAIGVGLAMVLGTLMDNFVMVPTKHYATTWVGIVTIIVIISKLLIGVFNRVALLCNGMSINMYILFPMIALSVIIMSYFLQKR